MSRSKAQGTRYETAVVRRVRSWLSSWGDDGVSARRLAEGGADDEGDVEASLFGARVVMECKARQVLNVQATLAKAQGKAGVGVPVVLWWKRLVRGSSTARRSPVDGVPEVVVLTPDTLFHLLDCAFREGRDGA